LSSVLLRIATVTRAKGDRQGAASRYDAARQMAESVVTASPNDRAALVIAGDIHSELSRSEFELRHYQTAETSSLRAMEIARRLVDLDPSGEHRDSLASAHNALGATRTGRVESPRPRTAGEGRHPRASGSRGAEPRGHPAQSDDQLRRPGDVLGYRPGENLGDLHGARRRMRAPSRSRPSRGRRIRRIAGRCSTSPASRFV
jgi:hypothetical protein